MRAEAYATHRKQGTKRQQKAAERVKGELEVGDVVDVNVTFKNRTRGGVNVLNCLIHSCLPGRKYKVVTRAGILKREIPRNEMHYRKDESPESLYIPSRVHLLPEIEELDALDLINPMRKSTLHCNCKNVSAFNGCSTPLCLIRHLFYAYVVVQWR